MKHTIETIQLESNKIHNNMYFIVSGQTYINNKQKLKFYCKKCNNDFYQIVNNHLNGSKCPICSKNEKFLTLNEIKQKIYNIHHNNIMLYDQKISGVKFKVKCKCNNCNTEFEMRLNTLLSGASCPTCRYNKMKNNLNNIREKCFKIFNNKYTIIDQVYKNNDNKIKIYCNDCNTYFEQYLSSLQLGYKGCLCKYKKLTLNDIQEKSKKIHGDLYIIPNQEISSRKCKIKIFCNKCNKYFIQRISDHFSGCGCNKCNMSKGEKIISQYFIEQKINFIPQHRFKECCDKLPLPFDFYLPDYNYCIEFDGSQHYNKNSKFYSELLIKHDKIKNNYCLKSNIYLLRISYKQDIKKELQKLYENIEKLEII